MKRLFFLRPAQCCFLVCVLAGWGSDANATISTGDVAIVRVNSSTDGFTVLALRDLSADKLYWTDNGWKQSNAFRTNENAGTTDILTGDKAAGSTFEVGASGLNNTGEQVFLFTGTVAAPHLLYGIDWGNTQGWDADAVSSSTSADPAVTGGGLADIHTVSLGNNAGYAYTGARTGTASALLAAISNPANWSTTTATNWTGGSFTVRADEPTVQSTNVTFSAIAQNGMRIAWTRGNGVGCSVVVRAGGAVNWTPSDGTPPTGVNSNLVLATDQGGGNRIAYAGNGVGGVSLVGLTAGTTYHVKVFEYNGAAGAVNYLTSGSPATGSATTVAVAGSAESDLARDTGFSEPVNIAYHLYQGGDVTASNSIEVARFTLRDGGADLTDADALSTTLSGLTFTVAGAAQLRRVALYVGAVEVAEAGAADMLYFSGLTGVTAVDGGNRSLSVRVTFATRVTDRAQTRFTVVAAVAAADGSVCAAGDAGGAASSVAGDANRLNVTATTLAFSATPLAVATNTAFSVSVEARDGFGSLDTDNAAVVTITKASGAGTLTGGAARTLAGGAATWNSLRSDAAGDFTLRAADAPDLLVDAISGTIATASGPLTAGDLAIIGYRGDAPDGFAFALWKPVAAGAAVYFTDSGFFADGTLRSSEDTLTWTAPAAGLPAGSVVAISCPGGSEGSTASAGSVSGGLNNLSSSGDQIFAGWGAQFPTGNDTSAPGETYIGTLLYGINFEEAWMTSGSLTNSNRSFLPATLNGLYRNISFGTTGNNGQYTGERVARTDWTAYRALVHTTANWTRESTGGTVFDISPFVLLVEPTTQAAGVVFGEVWTSQMHVGWTPGNGTSRLVVCREGGAPTNGPADGVAYAADADFGGAGSALGGGKVVYIGGGSGFTLSGLTAATTYFLRVFEFNGNGAATDYLLGVATGNPASRTTAATNSANADIVRAVGFSEPENIAYRNYQAADLTFGASIEAARFTVRDGGAGANDADPVATMLTGLTLDVAGSANLRRVGLYAGATELAEVAAAPTVSFGGLTGAIAPDNGQREISVRVSFQSLVTDHDQVAFTITAATASGSGFAAGDAGGAASSRVGAANRLEVTASALVFGTVPPHVLVDHPFAATVQARDAGGSVDVDAANRVTILRWDGDGTLTGGGERALSGGSANWSDLRIDTAGAFTLCATDTPDTLADAVSGTVRASAALQAGEIVFTGYNADGSDDFAIAVFTNILPGTLLYFRDGQWNGTNFAAGEGVLTWQSPAAPIAAGTIVTFNSVSTASPATSAGSVSKSGSFALGAENEGLWCYMGAGADAPQAFAAFFGNDTLVQSGNTLAGTGLVEGDTAFVLAGDEDILQYTGARTGRNAAGYRALLGAATNWVSQDGTGDQSNDGTPPDLPFDLTPFGLTIPPATVVITVPAMPEYWVGYARTVFELAGTAGPGTVGTLTWTNRATGGAGAGAAAAAWAFAIPLASGTNVITVAGTNSVGQTGSDSVALRRMVSGGSHAIAISEFMSNPKLNAGTAVEGQWIELYNRGDHGIDVGGWTIRNLRGGTHTITNSSLSVPPRGFVVLCYSGNRAKNGNVGADYAYGMAGQPGDVMLAEAADGIVLLDGAGVEVARVEYSNAVNWSDPDGASRYLSAPGLDSNDPANWGVSPTVWPGSGGDKGSPGAANAAGAWSVGTLLWVR